jgi:uncharacterized protein YndB with AHSA1/START domain
MKTSDRVPTERVMTLTRVFDAPRELVWKAFTQAEHIVHWMASKDWTTPSAETDPRQGGRFRIEMRALEGGEGFFFEGVYTEIVEPERIVQSISDGRVMRTTFEDLGGGRTRLTLTWEMAMSEDLERQGYTQILDKFTEYLRDRRADKAELILTRVFDAPRELVFAAWTEAEHLKRWFGPNGFTIPIAESEVRPGGAFRVCMRAPDGTDYWAKGVYREIVAPERIVCTMSGEGTEGNITDTLLTVTFAPQAGKTRVIVHQTGIPPTERRGASQGWSESLDKLAADLARP